MMRKIISIMLSIAMILSTITLPAYAAENPTVTFGDAVITDEQVKVPVVLNVLPDEWDGLGAFTIRYTYSADKLEYVDTESGAIVLEDTQKKAGSVSWYSGEAVTGITDTELFYLVFNKRTGANGDVNISAAFTEIASAGMDSAIVESPSAVFSLDPIIPAVVSLDYTIAQDGTVEVPVTLDKIPDELHDDIAAITFAYTYDTAALSYKETRSGLIEAGEDYAVAGKSISAPGGD